MATKKRLIDANAFGNGIGVYVTTNAYLNDTALDALGKVAKWLDEAPTVDAVEVVHGRWEKNWHDNSLIGHEYEECSVCGCMISDTEKFWDCNYCPNCGAKMMEVSNE